MKRTNSIIIIVIMLVGVVATAFIYSLAFVPNCGTPPIGGSPTIHGTIGIIYINSVPYYDMNVTFTAVQQSVNVAGTIFQTTDFQDPSFPRLQGTSCITLPNNPFRATLQVTFTDATLQTLTITYGGSPPTTTGTQSFTSNHTPGAGVEWLQGAPCLQGAMDNCILTLLVTQT